MSLHPSRAFRVLDYFRRIEFSLRPLQFYFRIPTTTVSISEN